MPLSAIDIGKTKSQHIGVLAINSDNSDIVGEKDPTANTGPTPRQCYKRRCCFGISRLVVSTVGLSVLVLLYSVTGGAIFRRLEIENEQDDCDRNRDTYLRQEFSTIQQVLNITSTHGDELNRQVLITELEEQLRLFRGIVLRTEYDGRNCSLAGQSRWTYAGATLFSVTAITTIGYGNLAPQTSWGRVTLVIYAVLGIPLVLLWLAVTGDLMARGFIWFYHNVICCKPLAQWRIKRKISALREKKESADTEKSSEENRQNQLKVKIVDEENENAEDDKGGLYSSENDGSCSAKLQITVNSRSHYRRPRVKTRAKCSPADAAPRLSGDECLGHGPQTLSENPRSGYRRDGQQADQRINNKSRGSSPRASMSEPIDLALVRLEESEGVPLKSVLLALAAYIIFGALIFSYIDNIDFISAIYFTVVTVSTIGFGDIVPGSFQDSGNNFIILGTALYTFFGMACMSMCFNLAQKEVLLKIRWLAGVMGVIKVSEEEQERLLKVALTSSAKDQLGFPA